MTNKLRRSRNAEKLTDTSITRRKFVLGSTALSFAAASGLLAETGVLVAPAPKLDSKRILVGSGTPNGILAYRWDAATGNLEPEGVAAVISHSTWLELSPDQRFLYVACELEEFEGKPTGAVASYGLADGKLTAISAVSSRGKGTCHLCTDHSGHVVICANYTGGSAASFLPTEGKLSDAVWNEHYTGYPGHGPVADRQEAAHGHFASVSPDNRFAYINDLGSDKIHIYKLDVTTANLTPAGTYNTKPGDGPRTLHFHPSGKVAYCINELNSSVDVLAWNAANGGLHSIQKVSLSPRANGPDGTKFSNTACDAVLTRDGRFAYFANRGDDFLRSYHINPATGRLTEFQTNARTSCGGKTPRNFRLDPTERWMLVANQSSSNLSVFARDPKTGELANEGRNFAAATPMCIVFV